MQTHQHNSRDSHGKLSLAHCLFLSFCEPFVKGCGSRS
jgi:hypothetical protein